MLKVFIDRILRVDWLVLSLIVIFDIRGCDIPILMKKMLEKIVAHESEVAGVLILQLLQLLVFYSVYDLVLEVFIH